MNDMVMYLNKIEEEVVLLKAVKELIDSMVNFEVLELNGTDPDSSITFKSDTHKIFFNIILVDFLSRTDPRAPIQKTSYLAGLKSISKNPSFNINNSVKSLYEATHQFINWLKQRVEDDVWLPSINNNTTLRISRLCFLKMCGDISKHNFLRSVGVAEKLVKALKESGVSIEMDDALLSLADFYEWFDNIFRYHSSTIAEFLNNIRWGIYEYLQPHFRWSIVCEGGDPPKYRYNYPEGVKTKFARDCYWQIMNEVRNQPYVRRFEVTECLKLRY